MTEKDGLAVQGAVWIDTEYSVREEAAYFGGPERLFGVTYRPAAPTVGVVICSPIYAELLRNYRREVVLARSLARSGYAVQRFHYRGSGNSDGEPSDVTFESLRDDAERALAHLAESTGVTRIAFVGTRLGAGVAAVVAQSSGAVALALWEPVLNAERYFREIFRGQVVHGLKKSDVGDERKPQERLHESGFVDVLGYSIDRRLYESVRARRLLEDMAVTLPHILLVRIGGSKGLGGDHEALVARWRRAGAAAETHQLPGSEPWWFGMAPDLVGEDPDRANELSEVTSEWMRRTIPRQD